MDNQQLYKNLCEREKNIPLFLTYGWLNTVAPGNWDVVLEEKGGEIIGAFPYILKKKLGFKIIELPPLTSYGGIWIKYQDSQKYSTKLSYEKEIYSSLIEKLPISDRFHIKFYPGFSNWLPFFWKGFKQTTAYTYIIEDLSNHELIFSEFKENIRREIRKAEKTLSVTSTQEIDILYNLKVKSCNFNKLKINTDLNSLKTIIQFCQTNNCGELLLAKDEHQNVHAAALFVRDANTTYYLYGASDLDYKNTGAMSLLMWKAIKRSSCFTKQFNFEGSMIEDIERFFRSFGAKQVPYFVIKKVKSKLLKLKEFISDFK